jgi:homoserine kinase
MRFSVKAPASSANLGPGFDAVGLALDLWNTVTIDTDGEPGKVTNSGTEAALLDGRENLTVTAMRNFAAHHHRKLPPFELVAETNIPVARGLGSSAAALVAGLIAADRLLCLNQTVDDFFAFAWGMEGHGDNVGAVLYGGAILAVPYIHHGIQLWDGSDNGLTVVVFIPEMTGATWAARAALPGTLPYADAVSNIAHVSGLVIGLKTGDPQLIGVGMNDMMHEPYRARLFPHLDPMKDAAKRAGAAGAALSGAGPTVLTLVPHAKVLSVIAALDETAAHLNVHGRTLQLSAVPTGAHLVESDTPSRV